MKNHLRVTFRGQSYWGQDDGYVFQELPGRPASLGQQVLDHGNNFMTTPRTEQELLAKLRNRYRRLCRADR